MDETDLRERLHDATRDLPARLDPHNTWEAARRRSGRRNVGVVAATVVATCAVAASVIGVRAGDPEPAPPATSPTSTGRAEKLAPGVWGETLPRGAAPEVAYLAGTTVHLPSGAVVDLAVSEGAEDAGIIGQTVAGLIVLVEHTDDGGGFGSRYVLVADDGTTAEMPASSRRPVGAAQDELISPDGRFFVNGATVIDKARRGGIVAEVPEAASVLIAWTSEGIIYAARGDQHFLWQPGSAPIPVGGYPGTYDAGTDVGLRDAGRGCGEVVRIDSAGEVTRVGDRCFSKLMSVSPDGARGLTTDLRVVDITTGEATSLADRPLGDIHTFVDVHWLSDTEFLVPIPDLLVRCDTVSLTCETATGQLDVDDYRSVQVP